MRISPPLEPPLPLPSLLLAVITEHWAGLRCCTAGSHWLSVLHGSVYVNPNLPIHPTLFRVHLFVLQFALYLRVLFLLYRWLHCVASQEKLEALLLPVWYQSLVALKLPGKRKAAFPCCCLILLWGWEELCALIPGLLGPLMKRPNPKSQGDQLSINQARFHQVPGCGF